jgi:oxygen-independent coproporphyrinogen-3 oxidase
MRPAPPVALYVHVPFCRSICPYCDFVVVAGSATAGPASRVPRFLRAVGAELRLRADALDGAFGPPAPGGHDAGVDGRGPLASVYLGGGTPSLLPGPALRSLLDLVRARFGLAPGAEVTLEANPGSGELGDLKGAVEAGVTRLSLGVQSLDPTELRRLGRRHDRADVGVAVRAARVAGMGSVSLDLLYDVPGQTEASWAATLDGALALDPDHLSLYALTLDDPDAEGLTGPTGDHLPTRPGARRWRERARAEQDDDRAAAMYEHADRRLAEAGLRSYEISNWARPGHRSRHNLAYWQRRPHEAVGPGAHAFDGAVRRWNAAELDRYLAALDPADGAPPRLPPGASEAADERAELVERVILGLRLAEGIPRAWVIEAGVEDVLDWASSLALVVEADGRLSLTIRGRLLSNEVFGRLV